MGNLAYTLMLIGCFLAVALGIRAMQWMAVRVERTLDKPERRGHA